MPLKAKSPYDKVLTGLGILENGRVSELARKSFVDDVSLLLIAGNLSGKTLKPISNIFPFPPVSGPLIPTINQHLFWFDKLMTVESIAVLQDKNKSPIWHEIFVDTLYQNTLQLLDLAGNTPLFPIFDPSAPFGIELSYPFKQTDLIKALKTTPPKFLVKLAKSGIKLSIPQIPVPKIPDLIPKIVSYSSNGIPSITVSAAPPSPMLPQLVTELIKLPFVTLTSLLVPPNADIISNIPQLPKLVAEKIFVAFEKILSGLGFASQLLPATMISGIIVYLKNIVACICVIIIASILGTGAIALSTAKILGLVSG